MKAQAWLAAIALVGAAAVFTPAWVAQAQDDAAKGDAAGDATEEVKGYDTAKDVIASLTELQKTAFADTSKATPEEIRAFMGEAFKRFADYIEGHPEATDHATAFSWVGMRGTYGYGQPDYLRIADAYLKANAEAKDKETWLKFHLLARLGIESEKTAALEELKVFEAAAKDGAAKLLHYVDLCTQWHTWADMKPEIEAFAGGWPLMAAYIENHGDATDVAAIYAWAGLRAANAYGNASFASIAKAYLKAKPDAEDANTWTMNLLYARLGIDTETKAAQAEMNKAEEAAKADAPKLIEYAQVRLKWYDKTENTKDKATLLKKLETEKVFTESTDEWVARRVHRIIFANSTAEIKDGEAFPDWAKLRAVKDIDGKTISVADFKGKVVLIDFWAVWCGPCMNEMPNVIKLYEETHEQGFDVIGVSLDNETGKYDLAAVRDTIAGKGKVGVMPWQQIYDGGGWGSGLAKYYGVRSIPKTVLIDSNGVVAAQNLRGADLDAKVKELLAAIEKKDGN